MKLSRLILFLSIFIVKLKFYAFGQRHLGPFRRHTFRPTRRHIYNGPTTTSRIIYEPFPVLQGLRN